MPNSQPRYQVTDRNLALELVRVTEAAAISSSNWTGRGKKNEADGAAVEAMRHAFDTVAIDGTVVIGEGEMDEAPMLYIGEKVGAGGPAMDIAVDPLEGTNLCAKDLPNAMTMLALAESGNFLHAPDIYMEKLVVGPGLPDDLIDIDAPIETTLRDLAKAKGKPVSELVMCALDRERHEELIARAREAGARVTLLTDGDVAAAIAACIDESSVDVRGVRRCAGGRAGCRAVRCVGGQMQGRLLFEDNTQVERAREMAPGKDPTRKLGLHDMARGDVLFSATGVTGGALLRGVQRFSPTRVRTHSIVMRSKSGTVRFVEGRHDFSTKTWTGR